MGFKSAEISIVITDDEDIKDLNKNFRGKDKATNVLSFPMMDQDMPDLGLNILGDLVISEQTAKKEAIKANISLGQRLSQLLIHGILHLIGYDHEISAKEDLKMTNKSKELILIVEDDKTLSHWM